MSSGCSTAAVFVGWRRSSAGAVMAGSPPKGTDCARKKVEAVPLGGCRKVMEKEWRRFCGLAGIDCSIWCGAALVPLLLITTGCSAAMLCGDCSWSGTVTVLAGGGFFGLGVDLFLLLVEGALREPRDLPLGQPWFFLDFGSSAGPGSWTRV
jgi:hypothetical protein